MSLIPESGICPGEGNGNPLQYSCLENPVSRGAWWARVHRVATSRIWLKQLSKHAKDSKKRKEPDQEPGTGKKIWDKSGTHQNMSNKISGTYLLRHPSIDQGKQNPWVPLLLPIWRWCLWSKTQSHNHRLPGHLLSLPKSENVYNTSMIKLINKNFKELFVSWRQNMTLQI